MDRLNKEYIELLSGEENPSDKFWSLEERIKKDKKKYEAIFVPEGVPAPPKSIINQPELQVYIADFG